MVYWGLTDSGEYFETVPLDASNPANRGVENPHERFALNPNAEGFVIRPGHDVTRPERLTTAATVKALPALYCERYVSGTTLSGNHLQADVDQRCKGAFVNHWIDHQLQHDSWIDWRDYTTLATSSSTSSYRYVWRYAAQCGFGGDPHGWYNYRMNTRGWARHVDENIVGGNWVHGGTGRFACGTGVS
ncbi:hypothetical protein GCM10012275_62750 [Longimycelium tulufanense]|uniref:Uncharacterized protein n=1 Tax=Longimycelium tulufanense TaxID=907463 RepID=A0A8J3CER3_9PSEU|nr:hypothetical protein [Longimycelium tulufanense]GGM83595.1 hypothetical protein GCM10012275_62750 [Longimycelium tulufanense]